MMNHVMGFDEVKIFHYLDHSDRYSLFSHFLNIQVFEICLIALEMFQTKVRLKVILVVICFERDIKMHGNVNLSQKKFY